MSVLIQWRRDTAANWTTANPVLDSGEGGLETDTGKAKMGDGSTAWTSLSYWSPDGTGGGAVTSVFGRTGAVTAESGDYTVSQVTGAAPLASPAFTAVPTAPTATAGTNTTQLATTAYAYGAAQTAETAAKTASLPLPSGGTYPGGTTEFLRADQSWAVPPGTGGGGGSGLVDWKDLVGTYGADPTGTTSSSSALASACAAATSASPAPFGLTVPPGNYLMTEGQLLPKNLIMQGAGAIGGTVTKVFGGTTFTISSSFNPAAGYLFGIGDTPGSTAANGPLLSGFGINGAAYTAEAVDGISITGPAFTVLRQVNVVQASGWGINTHPDTTASPIGADGQDWAGVTIDSCVAGGVRLIYGEDSTFRSVYIIGCGGDGWQLAGCDNTHFTDCRAEWNGNYGFHITNITDSGNTYDWTYPGGYVMFTGCSTDANAQSGFRVDATRETGQGSGTGPCVVQVNGPCFRRDGNGNTGAEGSWAGIDVNYSAAVSPSVGLPVYVQGPVVTTGTGDGDTTMSPRYGVSAASLGTAPFRLTGGGLVMGYTAATITSGTVTNYSIASTVDTFAGDNYNYTG